MKIRGRISGRLRDLLFICIGPLLLLAFYVILISRVGSERGAQDVVELKGDDLDLTSKSLNQITGETLNSVEPQIRCNFENYVLGQPINQTDPCLVATFKKKMLVSPRSSETVEHVPFNKTGVDRPSNIEKLNWVKKLLIENTSKETQFFFVESRAHDGESSSSTVRLETLFGWNGVLIEPKRSEFQKLLKKRKVWTVNTALCLTPHPGVVDLNNDRMMTDTSGYLEQKYGNLNKINPCIPLYTILKALNVTVVDFLDLNTNGKGTELQVLQTIPFNNVVFKIIVVEQSNIPSESENRVDKLKDLLESKGYKFVKTITGTNESLFVDKLLYEQKQSIIKSLVKS